MKFSVGVVTVLLAASTLFALPIEKESSTPAHPYVGQWSNGRGEVLVITEDVLKFENDKPVDYRDITKGTDDTVFQLIVTSKRKTNYFEKYIWITLSGRKEMKVETSDSLEAYARGEASSQTWYRDK